jgi:hypothetical protein
MAMSKSATANLAGWPASEELPHSPHPQASINFSFKRVMALLSVCESAYNAHIREFNTFCDVSALWS